MPAAGWTGVRPAAKQSLVEPLVVHKGPGVRSPRALARMPPWAAVPPLLVLALMGPARALLGLQSRRLGSTASTGKSGSPKQRSRAPPQQSRALVLSRACLQCHDCGCERCARHPGRWPHLPGLAWTTLLSLFGTGPRWRLIHVEGMACCTSGPVLGCFVPKLAGFSVPFTFEVPGAQP